MVIKDGVSSEHQYPLIESIETKKNTPPELVYLVYKLYYRPFGVDVNVFKKWITSLNKSSTVKPSKLFMKLLKTYTDLGPLL